MERVYLRLADPNKPEPLPGRILHRLTFDVKRRYKGLISFGEIGKNTSTALKEYILKLNLKSFSRSGFEPAKLAQLCQR